MTTEKDNATIVSIPAHDTGEGLLRELNRFERLLNQDAGGGRPTQYEVRVDGLPVIRRTDNPARFSGVLDDIDLNGTKTVEVRLYQGDSQHNHRHLILLERNSAPRPAPESQSQSLAGLEERFEARLRERLAELEHKRLQEDYDTLKADLEELQSYADKQDAELAEYRSKRLVMGQIDLVEVGGALLEGFLRRNPHVLSGIPGGEALAGALLAPPPAPAQAQPQTQEAGATATRKAAPQVSEAEMEFIQVLRRMEGHLDEQQFLQALSILNALTRNPSRIEGTLAFVQRPAGRDTAQHTQTPEP